MNTFPTTGRALGPASELKIPIDAARAEEILDWVRSRMAPDPHGDGENSDAYQVTSLYFDTNGFDVFHRNGSFARSKYRVRRYNRSDHVFLERKLRVGQQVRKRRSSVGMEELTRLTNGAEKNGWPGGWFHRRLLVRRLNPICQLTYGRVARMTETSEGALRLTVDQEIHACSLSSPEFRSDTQPIAIAPARAVVELKFQRHMPALFRRLIEEFALEPRAFSKYRLAVSELGFIPQNIPENDPSLLPKRADA